MKMTADDDSCSSYDSISATDLTVGTTNTGPGINPATDIDNSSCNRDDSSYQQVRIERAILGYLLLI